MAIAPTPMIPVKSSAVTAIGPYNPATQSFRVQYKSGAMYDFSAESQLQYDALVAADSIGQHLNTHFRGSGVLVEDSDG